MQVATKPSAVATTAAATDPDDFVAAVTSAKAIGTPRATCETSMEAQVGQSILRSRETTWLMRSPPLYSETVRVSAAVPSAA